jgi:hypothetical protein
MCVFVNNKKPSCWWDEFNTIQSHRYSMCLTPTLARVFFSSLSLSLSVSRSLSLFLFFSTDGSTIEKRKFFFSFWEKYKHWIRIISFFNSSTWFTVCYSKGVSMYCSLSLSFSRSSLIAAVGSGICKQTTAFVRFPPFLAERNEETESEREKNFLSLSFTPPIRCHPM